MFVGKCVETIWIKENKIQSIAYHQARYEATRRDLYKVETYHKLVKFIDPKTLDHEDVKCRIVYDARNIDVEYDVYQRKTISILKLVVDNTISYPFKTVERPTLDTLYGLRGDCDEIIIVKNGFVTDAYYFSLVFENRDGLFVPTNALLPGTQRQKLLNKNLVKAIEIRESDMKNYAYVHLVNALNPLGYHKIDISMIK